jgi:hypothetical protein
VIAITGCQYAVPFDDCQVTCTGGDTCPTGLTCLAGMCRTNGATGACGSAAPPPGSVTLSQTADTMIDSGLDIGCQNSDGTTPDQSWYRVFSLSAAGIDDTLHVSKVTIGIRRSVAGASSGSGSGSGIGDPIATVNLGTYSGGATDATLDLTKVTAIQSITAEIPASQIAESVDAPISADIPGDSNLVVEIRNADYNGTGKQLVLGATAATQTQAPYLRAPTCSVNVPTTTQTSNPTAHMIITVTGTK